MANYSDIYYQKMHFISNVTFPTRYFRIYKVDWSWNNGDWKWTNARDMTETFKNQLIGKCEW